jgi:enterochelin esterase-like enzyme
MSTRSTAVLGLALAAVLCVAPARSQQPGFITRVRPPDSTHRLAGQIERVRVHGASLAGNLEGDDPDREVLIYLPPSYAKDPERRYPVLYLLHGFTDTADLWFGLSGPHFVNLPRAADAAYAHGVKQMIIVMPDAFTKYEGSMYGSSAVTGDWETFVTRELVQFMDTHYRTLASPASRGLAGHSMGGYGTVRLAMKYPGVFSSIYAMSPCCLAADLHPSPKLMKEAAKIQASGDVASAGFAVKAMLASAAAWSPDPRNPPSDFDLPIEDGKPVPSVIAAWAANAPLAMVYQYIANLKTYGAIAFDAGDRDVGIANTVRSLDEVLTAFGVPHRFQIYHGNHIDHIQQRLTSAVLPFFGKHLKYQP